MFELHAWFTIRDTPGPESDPRAMQEVRGRIEDRLQQLPDSNPVLFLRWLNGALHLLASAFMNRKGPSTRQMLDLFEYVGEIAPGSYGLVYFYDDEDEAGHSNEFQTLVMTRGRLAPEKDELLSPFIPKLEDPAVESGT